MEKLYCVPVAAAGEEKTLEVYCGNILDFPDPIDVMTTTAYEREYEPTVGSLFSALATAGICVDTLAQEPELDLRNLCNCWLSGEILGRRTSRIGCMEMSYEVGESGYLELKSEALFDTLRSYFQMLDIAAGYRIPVGTVTMPLPGGGNQNLSPALTLIPVIKECVAFLKRCPDAKRICFVERNPEKAEVIVRALQTSYTARQAALTPELTEQVEAPLVFLSYSSPDKNIADNLCAKLEQAGFRVWYAPRDVRGPYAAAIVDGIERSSYFVVILSCNSLRSEHVLNEIDLAFHKLPDHIKFRPLRIDSSAFSPSFHYYLSRQHWMDAVVPPLEQRLNEFVANLSKEL